MKEFTETKQKHNLTKFALHCVQCLFFLIGFVISDALALDWCHWIEFCMDLMMRLRGKIANDCWSYCVE